MNKPEYVKIDDKLYKINTDFRVALECNKISNDGEIGDYERGLAIIFKLFGEAGLKCENQNKLLEKGLMYLLFNKDIKSISEQPREKYELDLSRCEGLIKSSFKFDYGYDPYELEYLHYYDFYNDLENLSSNEFGNCCILSRVVLILNQNPLEIKDAKQRSETIKTQKNLAEKYCVKEGTELSGKEKNSVLRLYKELGLMEGGN